MAEGSESLLLEKTGWDSGKLELEISAQQERFAGLLTREGAIEIIAREAGVPQALATAETLFHSLAECKTAQGRVVNARVRVWHVFSPKKFVRKDGRGGERQGRVCNVLVRDSSGEAVLVFWGNDVSVLEKNSVERNDVLEVKGAFVKNASPLELHASLLTRVSLAQGDTAQLVPQRDKKAVALKELSEGMADADFHCRVLRVGKASEFVRISKTGVSEKGLVCDALVSDGVGSMRLVGWDENASALSRISPGTALKVESAYVKRGRDGELEAHASWQGRIIPSPKNHGLAGASDVLSSQFTQKQLSELAEGDTALVSAKLIELRGASVAVKCVACGAKATAPKCAACGGDKLRSTLVVRTRLDDGSANLACVFFGEEALTLLGLKELSVEAQTALDLKKDSLLGREVSVVVAAKNSEYSQELECVAKLVASTEPQAIETAKWLEAKLGS